MSNMVITMRLLKVFLAQHGVMSMADSVQKGTPTSKIFKNDSLLAGWYQSRLSRMIAMGILKRFSGTVPYDVT